MGDLPSKPLEGDDYSHRFNAATVKYEDLVKSGVAASARRQSGCHRCPAEMKRASEILVRSATMPHSQLPKAMPPAQGPCANYLRNSGYAST